MEENGHAKPAIRVVWDAEAQSVALDFDAADFRTWEFVIAALGMATRQAEDIARVQKLQQIQAQQAEAQANESLKRRLLGR